MSTPLPATPAIVAPNSALLQSEQGPAEVTEGTYQAHVFDLSDVTFIEGTTGVIVLDPLISTEAAAAALAARAVLLVRTGVLLTGTRRRGSRTPGEV